WIGRTGRAAGAETAEPRHSGRHEDQRELTNEERGERDPHHDPGRSAGTCAARVGDQQPGRTERSSPGTQNPGEEENGDGRSGEAGAEPQHALGEQEAPEGTRGTATPPDQASEGKRGDVRDEDGGGCGRVGRDTARGDDRRRSSCAGKGDRDDSE